MQNYLLYVKNFTTASIKLTLRFDVQNTTMKYMVKSESKDGVMRPK